MLRDPLECLRGGGSTSSFRYRFLYGRPCRDAKYYGSFNNRCLGNSTDHGDTFEKTRHRDEPTGGTYSHPDSFPSSTQCSCNSSSSSEGRPLNQKGLRVSQVETAHVLWVEGSRGPLRVSLSDHENPIYFGVACRQYG